MEQALFEEIGRAHYQHQRDLTPLLGAYRSGATVAWRHVSDTALLQARVLADDPLFVDEHLDVLVSHRDHRRAALPQATRDRLIETLTSWLMNMGKRKTVADELYVHPQTVRYRLAQLRELFGPALDDPAARAALLLALAWGPAATDNNPQARHE